MDPLRGKSLPLCHSRVCCLKPAGSRRCIGLYQRHFFFLFLLVVLAAFVFYRTPFKLPGPLPHRLQNKSLSLTGENKNVMILSENSPTTETPPPGPYLVEYPYKYHFTINEPDKCKEHKPFVVLMVPVAPNNTAHRDIIRNTWGSENLVLDKVVRLFFLLGKQSREGAEELQEQLLQESKEHGDLIQSNFVDCYKNLTIKTMVMMEWLDTYCSDTPYAMKIDSDMFLNVPKLIRMLLKAPTTNYMTGLVAWKGRVIRDPKSRWYVPRSLYAPTYYPRYALGLGYVFSVDLPKKLVEAARHVKAIYIEDVYLGLCMHYLRIRPKDPPNLQLFRILPVQYSRCAYSKLIATTTDEQLDLVRAWKHFKRPGRYC